MLITDSGLAALPSLPATCTARRPPPCVQLVRSGARDELKRLARQRLEESGWTDEVRQLCRGAAADSSCLEASVMVALSGPTCMRCLPASPCIARPTWPPALASPRTDFVAQRGEEGARHEEIVAGVKAAARAKVPDNLKAELLRRIRDVLEG